MIGKRLRRRSKRLSTSNVQTKPLDVSIGIVSDSETTSDKWSKLPEDLLHSVVDRFVQEKDFIMFRMVCTSWRSAVPRSYWKRAPWLLAKRYQTQRVVLKGLSSFQNTSLSSLYQTQLLWRYWGSFTGWILGQNHLDLRLKLINPLTKAVIHLPRLHCLINKGLVYHSTRRADCSHYPSIEVMAISDMLEGVAILDHGYKEWKVLEDVRFQGYYGMRMINHADINEFVDVNWNLDHVPARRYNERTMINHEKSNFVDAIWYKDHVTAIRADGTIVFFDEARVVVSLPPPAHVKLRFHYLLYLVESSGDLLIVVKPQDDYKVYKLNIDTGEWIHVRALGRHSLFLGQSYSISRWMSKNDTGDAWKPGCIYKLTDSVGKSKNKLYCYNVRKKKTQCHKLDHVSDLSSCYDFMWYMPAVGSQ